MYIHRYETDLKKANTDIKQVSTERDAQEQTCLRLQNELKQLKVTEKNVLVEYNQLKRQLQEKDMSSGELNKRLKLIIELHIGHFVYQLFYTFIYSFKDTFLHIHIK